MNSSKKCLKHGVVHKNGGYASCVYASPKEEKCHICHLPLSETGSMNCSANHASPTWEEKEREEWQKHYMTMSGFVTCEMFADYWIERMKAVQKTILAAPKE